MINTTAISPQEYRRFAAITLPQKLPQLRLYIGRIAVAVASCGCGKGGIR